MSRLSIGIGNRVGKGGIAWNAPTWYNPDATNNIVFIGDSFAAGYSATDREDEGYVTIAGNYLKSFMGDAGNGCYFARKVADEIYEMSDNYRKYNVSAANTGHVNDHYSFLQSHLCGFYLITININVDVTGKTFDYLYRREDYAQNYYVYLDDVEYQHINTAAAATYGKLTINGVTNQAHNIKFLPYDENSIIAPYGIIQYNGNNGINIIQTGVSGWKVDNYRPATGQYTTNFSRGLTMTNAKAVVIQLGYNEYLQQVALNTFETNLTNMVNDAVTAVGAEAVYVINCAQVSTNLAISIEDYNGKISDVATATGVIVIDLYTHMGTRAQMIAAGDIEAAGTFGHPTTQGHAKIGAFVGQKIMAP